MRNRKFLLSIAFIFLMLVCIAVPSFAKDLDEIQKYYVTVDTRKDGTLDMTYYIEWKVLDSTSEGPLEWVKIGVPNSHVDTIKALTKNIAKINYTSLGGDFIRIDFDRAYRAGEVIKFSFSTHQSYMYKITSDGCKYTFTPGWFSDIAVKDARIFWDSKQVVQSSSSEINTDNYYVWKDSLRKNERITAEVKYGKNTFTLSGSMQATNSGSNSMDEYLSDTSGSSIIIFIFILIVIVYFVAAICSLGGGGYRSHGGYGYDSYRHHHHHHHRSCVSSCVCVSSCACACACAGGGRAGCSRKDFYGTKLKVSSLNKVLK